MRRAPALGIVLLAAVGCGGVAAPDVFIAFAEDFRGYHGWRSFDVTDTAPPGTLHAGETLTDFIDPAPPPGSDAFPVGTKIVKEPAGPSAPATFFAMVKRGGGFNASGASGWEWFEIQNAGDGRDGVTVNWRGVGPPVGDMYGGDPTGGCNTCHSACGNDSVCAPALGLSGF